MDVDDLSPMCAVCSSKACQRHGTLGCQTALLKEKVCFKVKCQIIVNTFLGCIDEMGMGNGFSTVFLKFW